MFWPKQMYDRNTSPNPKRRKSKEQIVLSTCVGYGQKPQKHQQTTKSRLIPVGATQLKGASHLWQCEFLSAPISLDALWSSSVHTAVPNSSAAARALQCSWVHQVQLVIWILSYEHRSSREQEILCVHSTLSYYCWLPSGLLLCLTGAQQLDWQQASLHSWHLPPSQCMSGQEVRMLLLL